MEDPAAQSREIVTVPTGADGRPEFTTTDGGLLWINSLLLLTLGYEPQDLKDWTMICLLDTYVFEIQGFDKKRARYWVEAVTIPDCPPDSWK